MSNQVSAFEFLRAIRDDRSLTQSAKAVAAISFVSRRSDAGICNPGLSTIAADIGCKDTRTVEAAIRCLEENGYITVERIRGKGNRYTLQLPAKNVGASDVPTKNVPTNFVPDHPQKMRVDYPQKMRVEETKEEAKEETNTSMASAQVKVETATGSEVPQLALLPDTPEATTSARADAIPYSRIVEIYNRELGHLLGMCQRLTAQRKACIRQRWADIADIVESKASADVLEGFQEYYRKVSRSDFLMGRVNGSTFKATFDWIHKAGNFVKIFENNYANNRNEKPIQRQSAYHHIPI